MNAITPGASAPAVFHFQSSEVRTITRDGEPWFVLADVAEILGFSRSRNAARVLDDDEKGAHILSTPGGDQEVTIISESGVYALALRSRRPEAKPFRKFVTAEVLPAIRKTGRYETPERAASTPPPFTDRPTRSRINRRALELSHRAYETYRDQMLTCHLIKNNRVTIEEWLPPPLSADVVDDARLVAKILDIYSQRIRESAAQIARLAGLEQVAEQ